MNTNNIIVICISIVLIVIIVCLTLIKKWVLEQNRSVEKSFGDKTGNFKDQLSDRSVEIFIAHSARNEANKEKWVKLKKSLTKRGYSVFEDKNSLDKNDIKCCLEHMESSTIIIVLVGDKEPFKDKEGVFFEELKHLGGNNWAEGKLIYICSYGIANPLDVIVNEIGNENDRQYLADLKMTKTHNFNIDNMDVLAQRIDDEYGQLQRAKYADDVTTN